MEFIQLFSRIRNRLQRTATDILYKRSIRLTGRGPFISFTFDDFPRSALHTGGEILVNYGFRGTYYASFGLMGKVAPTGPIFIPSDIEILLVKGHELGCHTYSHCHSWDTSPDLFEESIKDNLKALHKLVPGTVFRSFSYPISHPRPTAKRRAGKYFGSCRNGGQNINTGMADLNLLNSFFLEKSITDLDNVKKIIDRNCQLRGWLIFSTHDVGDEPTRYGCTTAYFENVVKYSLASGATVLPVAHVLDILLMDGQ